MDMENIKDSLRGSIDRLKEQSRANKGFEYQSLWMKISFAAARDGHIRILGTKAFTVFIVIRTYMNKDKIAYPSLKTISHQSGLSIKTVEVAIDKLIDAGWIEKTGRVLNRGKFGNTKYFIRQRDLIRATGDPSFMKEPVVKITNGERGGQW